jgi:hypothetical protein
VDLGLGFVLPEAEEERWGDLLLAFDIGVGDDFGIRTGADMASDDALWEEAVLCGVGYSRSFGHGGGVAGGWWLVMTRLSGLGRGGERDEDLSL